MDVLRRVAILLQTDLDAFLEQCKQPETTGEQLVLFMYNQSFQLKLHLAEAMAERQRLDQRPDQGDPRERLALDQRIAELTTAIDDLDAKMSDFKRTALLLVARRQGRPLPEDSDL